MVLEPDPTGAASLADVAQRSGVSLATASRVLNPDSTHPVSAMTREKVMSAAAALDYRMNGLARGLKMRRSQTIGIIVHDIRDPYFGELAWGVSSAAERTRFLPVICNSDRDAETELRYVEMLLESRATGLLFVGGGLEDAGYRTKLRRYVAAMRAYGGYAIALGPRGDRLPAEVPDNRGGARLATEHLLGLGHRRIAFIDGPPGLKTSAERRAGYLDALAVARVAADEELIVCGNFSEEGGAAATRALIQGGTAFTAVFSSNDVMAIGCRQGLSEAGLRSPEDVSVVGFDDIPLARWLDPPLTTVGVPMAEIGAAGMTRLLAFLEGDAAPSKRRLVNVHPTRLVVRASTGPAPRRRSRMRVH